MVGVRVAVSRIRVSFISPGPRDVLVEILSTSAQLRTKTSQNARGVARMGWRVCLCVCVFGHTAIVTHCFLAPYKYSYLLTYSRTTARCAETAKPIVWDMLTLVGQRNHCITLE